jgi:hypothetical protein
MQPVSRYSYYSNHESQVCFEPQTTVIELAEHWYESQHYSSTINSSTTTVVVVLVA